jgi:hypothetical protein
MEKLPSAKTIKFEILQLGQTLLSRPSFCNEKLLPLLISSNILRLKSSLTASIQIFSSNSGKYW